MSIVLRALTSAAWVVGAVVILGSGKVQSRELVLYLDAEFQEHEAAARAIEVGLLTAIATRGDRLPDGMSLKVLRKDHRGNVKRSRLHMQQFLNDPDAVAMIGGLHSPPYLKYRDFINENSILLLLPWSAGGPITRSASAENWVFRLSVDDTKAGHRLVSHAVETRGCKRPALWLWDSGWGRSNEVTMKRALEDFGVPDAPILYFNGSLSAEEFHLAAVTLDTSGADCALLVSNAREGAGLIRALSEIGSSVEVISHWGITGGRFAQNVTHDLREAVGLEVLQTCFSYGRDHAGLAHARDQFVGDFDADGWIEAPTGFFHGHDIGVLLIEALAQADGDGNIADLRHSVHVALEAPDLRASGLLRDYAGPYSAFSPDHPDAHEALGAADLCVTKYDRLGRIVPPRTL